MGDELSSLQQVWRGEDHHLRCQMSDVVSKERFVERPAGALSEGSGEGGSVKTGVMSQVEKALRSDVRRVAGAS